MQLIHSLVDLFRDKAARTRVTCLSVGLSYTAVATDDGGLGLAYTYLDGQHCCSMNKNYRDFEGRPAVELLEWITDPVPLHRSMGLALINALNYEQARGYPEDATDGTWMDDFAIGRGTRVAMVGFFRPLMKLFNNRGAEVEALDDHQGIGDRGRFHEKLGNWAEVLLITSTSILNGTTEEILNRTAPGVKVIMLGPSTPMAPEAFTHLPVRVLAGTVPEDKEAVLKAVRHGAGTPVLHRFSRKVLVTLGDEGRGAPWPRP
ncbi:MAG: DUF364 domain-containing protein [Syntrophobacteraceae bacterium]